MHALHDRAQARRMAAILLLLWLGLLALTASTWVYEPTGEPVGINPVASLLYLIAPAVGGFLVGRRQATRRASLKKGLLVGALVAAADMVALIIASVILLARGQITQEAAGMSVAEGVFEALSMVLFFVVIGAVAGAVGGLLGAWLASARRVQGAGS